MIADGCAPDQQPAEQAYMSMLLVLFQHYWDADCSTSITQNSMYLVL